VTSTDRTSVPFLDGVRVLDVTGALAGPYCTTVLSDLGAEVIKVEPPDGDGMRRRVLGERRLPLPFDMIHRNKRSVALDLKQPEGASLLRRLAGTAHVFVENFRPGALAALQLGYEQLAPECPDLVYCSISGFGQTGPMRDAKGVDLLAQAYGGLMSVTGSPEGELAKAGFPIGDLGSGMWACIGILAALLRARSGGGGAYIDVSLAETIAGWSLWEAAEYAATGEVPAPLGTAHRLAAPYEAFRCSDGESLALAAVNRQWPPLCEILGVPELLDDPRFGSESDRYLHREELAGLLQARFDTAPRDHWIPLLRARGIPAGPVNRIDQVIHDEHYRERKLFVSDEEGLGEPLLVSAPIVAAGAPRIRRRAPACGEDTMSLLRELGLGDAEIEGLVEARVVSTGSS
jgi:crotonobetainyl-CoA:carnitine CoA-transferase CaiB-like acyl-CoA transferase